MIHPNWIIKLTFLYKHPGYLVKKKILASEKPSAFHKAFQMLISLFFRKNSESANTKYRNNTLK